MPSSKTSISSATLSYSPLQRSKRAPKWGVMLVMQDSGPSCDSSGSAELHLSYLDYNQCGRLSALVTAAQWCLITFAPRRPGLAPPVPTAELRGQHSGTTHKRVAIIELREFATGNTGKSFCTRYYAAHTARLGRIVDGQAGLIVWALVTAAILSALRVGNGMQKAHARRCCWVWFASCATLRKAVLHCCTPLPELGQSNRIVILPATAFLPAFS